MKPVVAHVRHTYLPISETFIYEHLIRLQDHKPIFLASTFKNLDLFPFEGLRSTLPHRRAWWWFWDGIGRRFIGRKLYLEHILKKEKAVLIHAHYGNEGVEMLPVKKGLRLPLITTFYGYDLSRLPRQEKWRAAYKDLFYHGDLFLVEGNHMRRTLIALGCPPDKIRIQHLGIDLTKFEYQEHGIKGGEKVKILFCGRFMEKKGLIYALQAVKSVAKKYHNLEFKVIGDGELRPEIESFIAQHNMGRFVTLLGYQPHQVFAQEAHSAHVLVQPSVTAKDGDSEGGAPIVLLEAQASGLPVISTLHCDIPEYVLDGRSGFLVPEGDSTALAEKLEYLIENPNLWAQMGEIGREHVEKNYNVDEQVKKLERIYHELAFQL